MSVVYNSNLIRATGLVQETLVLLEAYQIGLSKEEFTKRVKEADLLGKAAQSRVKVILDLCFFPRYVVLGDSSLAALKSLQASHVGYDVLTQLFLAFTCRVNSILADFIRLDYWSKVKAGKDQILTTDPVEFIKSAIDDKRILQAWADSTIKSVSTHMIACLIDFRLIEKNKSIRLFSPSDATINFLLHEGHFRGLSDMQLLHEMDWEVLGLSREDLIRRIDRLAQRGHFIAQYSGELLTISWFYKSLTEATDGISRV